MNDLKNILIQQNEGGKAEGKFRAVRRASHTR